LRIKIVLLFVFLSFQSNAQLPDISFENLSEKEGLSDKKVYCFLRDKQGYLWIGTENGLNRYDGYSFKVFLHTEGDTNSLSNNVVHNLTQDSAGFIWVGTDGGGLDCYDPKTEHFRSYRNTPNDKNSISGNRISSVFIDKQNNLWVCGGLAGLQLFNRKTQAFENYSSVIVKNDLEFNSSSNLISQMLEDDEGTLWIATHNGLAKFDRTNHQFQFYYNNTKPENYGRDNVHICMFMDSEKNIWLGNWGGGLMKFNKLNGTFEMYKYNTSVPENGTINIVTSISQKSPNELWIATLDSGFGTFNMNTKKFLFFPYKEGYMNSIPSNSINTLYKDYTGTLWIGTNNGISKIDPMTQRFAHTIIKSNTTLDNKAFHVSVAIDIPERNELLLGTTWGDGLYIYDERKHQSIVHRFPGNYTYYNISAIKRDESGTIWVGSQNGLFQFDIISNQFITLPTPLNTTDLKNDVISTIIQDRAHNLWFATGGDGIYQYILSSKEIKHFTHSENNENSLISNETSVIAEDNNGNLFIGTSNDGISVYNIASNTFTNYRFDANNPNSISRNEITGIVVHNKGKEFIGTWGNGLNEYLPEGKGNNKFKRYFIKDGLPSDKIWNMTKDNNGNIWIATSKGLSKLNPDSMSFKNYDIRDGLKMNYLQFGLNTLSNGDIIIGDYGGFTRFNPVNLTNNPFVPDVVINSFKVFDKDIISSGNVNFTRRVDLSYKQNFFSVEFAALNLTNPEKNQYAYKLEGFDKDWNYCGTRRFASYTNLDGGDYILMIKAANNDGVWNDKPLSITIHVLPPFWKTWWFYLLSAIIISVIIYLIYKIRINQIRKEEAIKTEFNKKIAEIEMVALRAQMNPHFIFNCLNSINRYIVKSDQVTASNYLTKFAKLIRLILDNSRHSKVALENELNALKLYIEMEAMRFDNKFSYAVNVSDDLDSDSISIPPMILQPYVENAIWHGLMHKTDSGVLSVNISKENDYLKCIIEDNGVGRERAMELKSKNSLKEKSLGIKVTNDRISIFNQLNKNKAFVAIDDLKDKHGNAIGTRVTLMIPLDESGISDE